MIPSGKIGLGYKKFFISNCVGNFICGISSVCSTHGMLGALIDNNQTNIDALSVSLNIIGKDILGSFIAIPVINSFSRIGDKDPKFLLKISLFTYEFSNLMECVTPLINRDYFIPLASLGNVGKSIGFTGYGSFNAKKINELSIDKDNISEIYSRLTTISSISFSFGMMFGLGIVKLIPDHQCRLALLPFLGYLRYRIILSSI